MIQVKEVSKAFQDTVVFENASASFEKGKIYCLTGRNGCGKTVLMKMLCRVMKPDAGKIILPKEHRFGVIIETPGFWHYMTGYETLRYLASIRDVTKETTIQEYLKMVGLWEARDKKVGRYSLGMRQKLAIAQALMENPDIILMDEPTNALDDEAVEIFRQLMLEEKEKQKYIILATHNIEDVQTITDSFIRVEKKGLRMV